MYKNCTVEGCDNKHFSKGYCEKHYKQFKRHGRILERTRYDKNKIIKYKDYAEVVLYDKNNIEVARTKIDLKSINLIENYKWYLSDNGYVVSNINSSTIGMHRIIMKPNEDMVVDHINHNKLDNREENLRICKHCENDRNKGLIKSNTSGVTGVCLTPYGTWCAKIEVDKKCIHLGTFKTFEEATKVRKEAEIKYFGEYRYKGEGN